jgi:hypothetical protein
MVFEALEQRVLVQARPVMEQVVVTLVKRAKDLSVLLAETPSF